MIMFGYILLTPMGISFAIRRTAHSEVLADDSDLPHMMERFVLADVHVRDILDQTRIYPEQTISVRNFVEHWTTPEQHDYVVVDRGQLAGVFSLSLLRYLPRTQWARTPLQGSLRQSTPQASPGDLVEDVLQQMIDSSTTVMPVVNPDTGEFLGSISSYEILEMILLTAGGRDI